MTSKVIHSFTHPPWLRQNNCQRRELVKFINPFLVLVFEALTKLGIQIQDLSTNNFEKRLNGMRKIQDKLEHRG